MQIPACRSDWGEISGRPVAPVIRVLPPKCFLVEFGFPTGRLLPYTTLWVHGRAQSTDILKTDFAKMDRPLGPSGRRGRSLRPEGRMIPAALLGTILSLTGLTFTGCAYSPSARTTIAPYRYSSCCCCSIGEIKARMKAHSIWREKYAHCYGNRANAHDIKAGFVDGYVETMGGGSGCPPMIAPQRYSGLACLTHGKPAPGAWFEGYPLGAAVAESCGALNRGESSLNPALLACFKKEPSCNPGCCPCEPSTCGCGQSCSGGCGDSSCAGCQSGATFGGPIQTIRNGMKDEDGAVIIEHSTAPTAVPAENLPSPATTSTPNTPSIPQPTDAPETVSDRVSENSSPEENSTETAQATAIDRPVRDAEPAGSVRYG